MNLVISMVMIWRSRSSFPKATDAITCAMNNNIFRYSFVFKDFLISRMPYAV
ncbi:hypothetical protein MtrunA17_Chr1g0186971 [Medicago truncatula]|uniref:Uncharacterized protein n=1 Tax=Medicago truncatula TaxID=3880 RepID=A0A396JPU4_MEDTR|nr:hypothetical protein MtrunA17_Chr1g0186971 [Medicago truncatula]